MVTGNRNILNSIKGITSVVKLTAEEKTALADRVLPANILIINTDGALYVADGVTAIKDLKPLAVDGKTVHQTGDETIAGTKTFSAAIVGSVTGNAGSATKLATARTINGIAFDGTANITIPGTVPAGVIIPFAGTSVPTGYLLCNGAAVSRTDYANLFAAIGTLYGAGDGSTTFNLPDARDRVLQGTSGKHSVGSYIAAGLPNITGWVGNSSGFYTYGGSGGAFSLAGPANQACPIGGGGSQHPNFNFNAHASNALYGASNTVQSPAIATNFIIKY